MICPPGTRLVFPGTRSERCVPAVTSAPAAAAAELAKVGARTCTSWDRVLKRIGFERDCVQLPQQQLGELPGPAGKWSPSRRLVGALALGGLAITVGLALGVFTDDDDAEEAP